MFVCVCVCDCNFVKYVVVCNKLQIVAYSYSKYECKFKSLFSMSISYSLLALRDLMKQKVVGTAAVGVGVTVTTALITWADNKSSYHKTV